MLMLIVPVVTKIGGLALFGFSGASWLIMDAPRVKVALLFSIPAAVFGIILLEWSHL